MKKNHKLKPIDKAAINKARRQLPKGQLLKVVVEGFEALSDPTRTKILYFLLEQPLCVRDLAILVGVSESAISHQLSFLKGKCLVKSKRKGNIIFYSIAYQHLTALLKEAEYYSDHVSRSILDHPYKLVNIYSKKIKNRQLAAIDL